MGDFPPLHGPARPAWTCLACGEPWPCPVRKRQLKELCRCDVRLLVNYMTPYLRDARVEIVDLNLAEITELFVGWCRRPLGQQRADAGSARGGAGGGPTVAG
jgi:hypothetical protein